MYFKIGQQNLSIEQFTRYTVLCCICSYSLVYICEQYNEDFLMTVYQSADECQTVLCDIL